MARIRTIKPEFWSNDKVMACSREVRLLFVGLWNFADDAGRLSNTPKTIKAQVLPGDEDINSTDIQRWLDEMSSSDLILQYEVLGRTYIQILGWNHQKIDRPRESQIPPPSLDDLSSRHRRSLATDLTLSNLNGPVLAGKPATVGITHEGPRGPSAGSLASALPTGALARPPDGEDRVVIPISGMTRTQLAATYHRRTYADLTKPPACPCCIGWVSRQQQPRKAASA